VSGDGRAGVWTCPVGAVAHGQSIGFSLLDGDRQVQGLLVNWQGIYHAYVNRCPHAGTPLDLWPNEFFTEDGRWLVCATHGAIFAPESGICVEGPCPGARLEPLAVSREGDRLAVRIPC
jgi:nitrite reductase/ring-hydroxylating ferredoxin subunit